MDDPQPEPATEAEAFTQDLPAMESCRPQTAAVLPEGAAQVTTPLAPMGGCPGRPPRQTVQPADM